MDDDRRGGHGRIALLLKKKLLDRLRIKRVIGLLYWSLISKKTLAPLTFNEDPVYNFVQLRGRNGFPSSNAKFNGEVSCREDPGKKKLAMIVHDLLLLKRSI